jgi:DNA-binding NtrC family response regulator
MRRRNRVILLDDEAIVCERLKHALEKCGFEVAAYTDSQEAVDRLSKDRFDVLITDLKMKKPDGLDVMNFVNRQSPSTKVVIITGYATADTATEAMKSGAVDFIAKPFKIKAMCDLVARITAESKPE